jgi:hypothetical protein
MGRRRSRNKPNAKGRNQTSRFARLDFRLLYSNAYRSLSPNARSLLVELASLDNGENNGSLYLSVRDGAHRMGVADLTAATRAFNELTDLGFIEMTQDAYFQVKASDKSRARCWRLTWLAGPGRQGPSMAFMNREPEPQTKERKRMERGLRALKNYRRARSNGYLPVLDSNIHGSFDRQSAVTSVLDTNTPECQNGGNQPKCRVTDSATHIAVTIGNGSERTSIGWWQPDWSRLIMAFAYTSSLSASLLCARQTLGEEA